MSHDLCEMHATAPACRRLRSTPPQRVSAPVSEDIAS